MLLAVFTTACSGTGSPFLDSFGPVEEGVVEGTFEGESFVVGSTVSAAISRGEGNSSAAIVLASTPDLCELLGAGVLPYGAQFVSIEIFRWNGTTTALPTSGSSFDIVSSFTPDAPRQATASYYRIDQETCALAASVPLTGGLVSVDVAYDGIFRGASEASTGPGENVTLRFDPRACPAVSRLYTSDALECL